MTVGTSHSSGRLDIGSNTHEQGEHPPQVTRQYTQHKAAAGSTQAASHTPGRRCYLLPSSRRAGRAGASSRRRRRAKPAPPEPRGCSNEGSEAGRGGEISSRKQYQFSTCRHEITFVLFGSHLCWLDSSFPPCSFYFFFLLHPLLFR